MIENPFDSIKNIYDNMVEDVDKLGYAKTFKKCTELFFEAANEDYTLKENAPIHFSDIEYLSGYYIFGHGTNSVAHFHIDECPGWKFGIWWNVPKEGQSFITGIFFTQFEEAIDKFKPSASQICRNITIYPDECCRYQIPYVLPASEEIKFIRDEPYLAFCRDYYWWDYNKEYHTQEEAKSEYQKYRESKDNEYHYTALMDKKILEFVEKKVLPVFKNAEIIDHGDGWSPRFDVVAPLKDNRDIVNECGCYDWFENDDEAGQIIMAEYNRLIKMGKEYGNQYRFYYSTPIHGTITFYEE